MTPMEPLQTLGRKLREIAQTYGCDMENFVIMPDLDGHDNVVQAVFVLPSEVAPNPEQLIGVDVDAEAERLLASLEDSADPD